MVEDVGDGVALVRIWDEDLPQQVHEPLRDALGAARHDDLALKAVLDHDHDAGPPRGDLLLGHKGVAREEEGEEDLCQAGGGWQAQLARRSMPRDRSRIATQFRERVPVSSSDSPMK